MRILFIHGDKRSPEAGGGAESLLRDQAQGLKALGHECSWWNGSGTIESVIDEFKPDVCHVMTTHCYPMGMDPVIYLQEHNIPHLIHVQDYWPFCATRMMMIGDRSCSAVAGKCRHECNQSAPSEYLEICNRSFIVAGNENTAEIYRRNGLRCDAIVELGVDTVLFHPADEQPEEIQICASCSTLAGAWKGMHILKQALEGSEHKLTILSGLERKDVAAELRKGNIFVFPSLYEETFGLSLCEAMATGLACISTDNAGGLAQIEDNITGIIVLKGDIIELRKTIDLLASNPVLRMRIGENARNHVVKEHSLEAMSKRWIEVYKRIIK